MSEHLPSPRHLPPRLRLWFKGYVVLYPQNGDRIVTVDSVTSLRPLYRLRHWRVRAPKSRVYTRTRCRVCDCTQSQCQRLIWASAAVLAVVATVRFKAATWVRTIWHWVKRHSSSSKVTHCSLPTTLISLAYSVPEFIPYKTYRNFAVRLSLQHFSLMTFLLTFRVDL